MTSTLTPADAPAWTTWITNFDAVSQSFTDNYNALVAIRPWVASSHPEELATLDQLLSDANAHIATLAQLKSERDYVASWLSWLVNGFNAGVDFLETNAAAVYNAAMGWMGLSGLAGLGIAPIIIAVGLVAAGAALVTIGYWIQRAYNYSQRINALQYQESIGLSPSQAAAVVDSTLGAPGGTDGDNLLGIPWSLLITGAVLVILGPKVIELMNARRSRAA